MIKICDSVLVKSLSIIFMNYIERGTFLDIWKKSNLIPVYKKGEKQCFKNHKPVPPQS